MPEILTFALVAPLGAMGSLAVGERRGTWDRPARSAVLGLVAGCLGIERSEEGAHAELSAGLGVAIRRLGRATAVMSDYHTAQTRPSKRNRVFATRREELANKLELETVLSRRDYRADPAFTIAVWRREAPQRWSLEEVADALRRPIFVPYLGRKSCPLGLPMAPLVLEADTLRAAFAQRDAVARSHERKAMGGDDGTIWADEPSPTCPTLGVDPTLTQIEWRRDELESRGRWQFGLRAEVVAPWTVNPTPVGGTA